MYIHTQLPSGVEVLATDTINGNDRSAQPRFIQLADKAIPLVSDKYRSRAVGSLCVREDIETHIANTPLVAIPFAGESVATFHQRALHALEPHNQSKTVSEYLAMYPELYSTIMSTAFKLGVIKRQIEENGKIREASPMYTKNIFGVDDDSPTNQGLLPSLPVLLTMDVLTTQLQDADRIVHLGGSATASYVSNIALKHCVSTLIQETQARLELPQESFLYIFADIEPLAAPYNLSAFTSQHELLRQMRYNEENV